jgi:hypothetical protein
MDNFQKQDFYEFQCEIEGVKVSGMGTSKIIYEVVIGDKKYSHEQIDETLINYKIFSTLKRKLNG